MTQLELAALVGSQKPRIESVPLAVTSAGQEAIELAALPVGRVPRQGQATPGKPPKPRQITG
ncbi:MAG TPA: hypothetical protein VGO16_08725 [Pseudonocardiaceae bacterium]|nr:hypothetical protein [Pseudonocardiaceae bacterium]